MKAILYEGAGKIAFKDVPEPEVKEGWGLIKVSYAGICGTDLNIYAGTHPRAKAPLIIGHEFSGTMVNDYPNLPRGTRVTVYPLLSCGHCEPCKTGNAHVCNTLKLLGIDCSGGMAEYVAAPLDKIVPLDDSVSDKLGAFVEPVAVTVHAVRESKFLPGDNALVFGCGTIGLATANTLRILGASSVTMVEPDRSRAQIARSMGFHVIDPVEQDLEAITQNLDHNGFDWVFDCAGVQAVAKELLAVIKVHGHIVIVAAYKKPAEMPLIQGMFKETSIQFIRVYRRKDFLIASKIISSERNYERIITHVLPAAEAQKGFDLLTARGTGAIKVMFQF